MVRIDPQSIRLDQPEVKGAPRVAIPKDASQPDASVSFETRKITTTGSVDLTGNPGEPCDGWKLGFFQLQLIETNRARYRGATPREGSVLVTRDKPPARTAKLCRDTESPGEFFYNKPMTRTLLHGSPPATELPRGTKIPTTGRLRLDAHFFDSPYDEYPIKQKNEAFKSPNENWIHSVEMGFAFCTILTAWNPGSVEPFRFLKHFYWNCRWYVHFSDGGVSVIKADMDLNLQHKVHTGIPNDPRFHRTDLLNKGLPQCKIVARHAALNPNIKPSSSWDDV